MSYAELLQELETCGVVGSNGNTDVSEVMEVSESFTGSSPALLENVLELEKAFTALEQLFEDVRGRFENLKSLLNGGSEEESSAEE